MSDKFKWDDHPVESKSEKKQEFNFDDHPLEPKAAPSQGESAIRGAVQGGTFGFGDEGAGVLGAGKDLVTGKAHSLKDLIESYKEYRDSERANNEAAQKANPGTYLASNLAGGFLLPGGAFLKGGKALAEAAPLLKAAPLLQKIATGAGAGALAGGVAGVGNSEGSTPGEVASDALQSAKTGALIGGGIPAGFGALGATGKVAGKVAKPVYNVAKNIFKSVDTVGKAAQKGYEGTNLSDLQGQLASLDEQAKSLGNFGLGLRKKIGEQYSNLLNQSKNKNIDISSLRDDIEKLQGEISANKSSAVGRDANKVNRTLGEFLPGSEDTVVPEGPLSSDQLNAIPQGQKLGRNAVSAQDFFNLQKRIGELAHSPETALRTGEGKAFAGQVDNALGGVTKEQLPDLQRLNEKNTNVSNILDQLGLNPKNLIKTPTANGVDTDLSPETLSKIQNIIVPSETKTPNANKANQALDILYKNLEALGYDTKPLQEKIANTSENVQFSKLLNGNDYLGGHGGLFSNSVKSIAKGANYAGLAANKLDGSEEGIANAVSTAAANTEAARSKPSKDVSKDVYNLPDERVSAIASHLASTPGLQSQGSALQKAIAGNNRQSRDSILFSLLQRPDARKLLEAHTNVK